MENPEKQFLKWQDVSSILDIGRSSAFKVISNLQKELQAKGYLTFEARIPAKYFYKRYGVTR